MNIYKIAIAEWYNSIYLFNSQNLNIILHEKSKFTHTLLNSYFNMNKLENRKSNVNFFFNFNLFSFLVPVKFSFIKAFRLFENSLDKNNLRYWKYLELNNINNSLKTKYMKTNKSLKRVFVSFPLIKHTNNSISLLIFVFNKCKILLYRKINLLNLLISKNKISKKKYLIKKLKLKVKVSKQIAKKTYLVKFKYNNKLFYYLNRYFFLQKKSFLFKRNFLANIYLFNFKYNLINLVNLYSILYKIFNKKISFNFVNLKYVHLDNHIFVDAITRKLNDRKKRVLRVLKKSLVLVKLCNFPSELSNAFLQKASNFNLVNLQNVSLFLMSQLKNKHFAGASLKASGRLTRRMTAARAVSKFKYKGNMKNYYNSLVYSSLVKHYLDPNFKGSDKLIRGCYNHNITFNQNNSYNKNGSFGISSKQNTI